MKSTKDSLLEDIKAEFAEVNAMMEALEAKGMPNLIPDGFAPLFRYMREAWQWNPSSLHWPDGCGRITVPP